MLDTDSPRLLTGLCVLTVTLSLASSFAVRALRRVLPTRSTPVPGELSFRTGELSRIGVGIDEVCLAEATLERKGV